MLTKEIMEAIERTACEYAEVFFKNSGQQQEFVKEFQMSVQDQYTRIMNDHSRNFKADLGGDQVAA